MSQKDDDFLVDDDFDVGVSDVDTDPVEYIDRPVKKISVATYAVFGVVLAAIAGGGYVFLKKPDLIKTLLHGDSVNVAPMPMEQTASVLTPEPQDAPQMQEPAAPVIDEYVAPLESLKEIALNLPPESSALPQPAAVANEAPVISDIQQLVAEQANVGAPEKAPEAKSKQSQQEIVRPKANQTVQPELEFFDSGTNGTIGPGSSVWEAENNIASRPSFENQIIVSSKLTKERQDSKLMAARNAFRAGRYETALRFYDELHDLNKKDRAVLSGRALTLQKMGRTEEAAKAYDDLLSIDPDNKQAIVNMLGIVRQNYPAVAAERLRALYTRYPDAPEIIAQLGVAQGELKNYEEALQYLSRAASIDPSNPLHYFNMAVIAEHMDKPDLAVRYYQRALEIDGASSGAKVNREMIYDRLSRLRN